MDIVADGKKQIPITTDKVRTVIIIWDVFFIICALKHMLWVLTGSASAYTLLELYQCSDSKSTHKICFGVKLTKT